MIIPQPTPFDLGNRFAVFVGSIYHPFPPVCLFGMWWTRSPALLLGLAAVPALAAQQCRLVLSPARVQPTLQAPFSVNPRSSHRPTPSIPVPTTSTPTPTPFVPFAYGDSPIRGVNLFVLFVMPG